VEGCRGEQFALPEAFETLRLARRTSADDSSHALNISAADPLNLVGIVTPGERVSGWRCWWIKAASQKSGISPRSQESRRTV